MALLTERDVPFLSSHDVAQRLAVSARTVRLWAELDEIPAIRVGRQWRFRLVDVEAWIRKRVNPSLETGSAPGSFTGRRLVELVPCRSAGRGDRRRSSGE